MTAKTWLVAERQIRQTVLKRGFLVALVSLPLFLGLTIGLGFLASRLDAKSTTLGVVDLAGVLDERAPDDPGLRLVRFAALSGASQALESDAIDAYVVLPADFTAARQVELGYAKPPGAAALSYLRTALRRHLLAGQPPLVIERVLTEPAVTVHALDTGRTFAADGPTAGIFVPLAVALLCAALLLTVSGTLMEAVVEEKENRTMEVLISSVSPAQMMAGKIAGTLVMALLLLAAWIVFLAAALWLGRSVLDIAWLQEIQPQWADVWLLSAVALPAFLTMAAAAVLIGSVLTNSQDAQQIGPFLFLLYMLPIYLLVPIGEAPSGLVATAATLFPPTAVMTLGIRFIFTAVPIGQIALAAVVSLASGLVMVWLTGQAFRLSMLRYGQRLRLRELWAGSTRR